MLIKIGNKLVNSNKTPWTIVFADKEEKATFIKMLEATPKIKSKEKEFYFGSFPKGTFTKMSDRDKYMTLTPAQKKRMTKITIKNFK